jgi:diguanylate cyclase (GGDEF)-like protein
MSCPSEAGELAKKGPTLAFAHAGDSITGGLTEPGSSLGPERYKPQPDRDLHSSRQAGRKLVLWFGLLIVILLGTAYLALDRMQRMNIGAERTLDESLLKLQLGQEALRYSSENSRITLELFLVQRAEIVDELLARREENSRRVSALLPVLEAQCESSEEKRLLEAVKQAREPYTKSYKRTLQLLLTEKEKAAAIDVMLEETNPALFRYHAAWDGFLRLQQDRGRSASEQMRQHEAIAWRIMLVFIFVMGVVAGGIAWGSVRKVARVANSRIRVQHEVSKLNAELEQRVTERTMELQRIEDQLRSSLEQLQGYTSRVETVNQLVELLQSCLTLDEAYQQASRVLQHFFPQGALLMLNPSRNLLDVAAAWGAVPAWQGPFFPENCWALRKGRTHVVQTGSFGLLCKHLDPAPAAFHTCVPMVAQGESLGVLSATDLGPPGDEANSPSLQRMQELASSLAEQISLAFANLMLRETLKCQSVRDPLTNLFNRRHMEEALQRELLRAARNGNPLAVLMADIDHFKQFNDAFGHEAGDVVLRDLGSLLGAEIRGADIACRYGGEEFLLILSDTDLKTACERAEKLQEQVRNMQVRYRGETLRRITLSIGVADFPRRGSTASQIVTAADRALYKAKASGRDRVAVAGEPREEPTHSVDDQANSG